MAGVQKGRERAWLRAHQVEMQDLLRNAVEHTWHEPPRDAITPEAMF